MLDDLDLRTQTVKVMGKGRRERMVHVEDGTALALHRYLRARRLHPKAATTDRLWIGKLGPLTGAGIQQILAAAPSGPVSRGRIRTLGVTPSPTAGCPPAGPRAA